MKLSRDILGIGTPVLDQIILISEADLVKIPGRRGGSEAVDYKTLQEIIKNSPHPPIFLAGGSAANTIRGLSYLGRRCALFGKIGKDEAGRQFLEELSKLKIHSHPLLGNLPTAQVVCLVTPDYERTMRYFLGAGIQLNDQDLSTTLFSEVSLVHIEGYMLNRGFLVEQSIKLAKSQGAKISFDISSVEIALTHQKRIMDLISSSVDIVFANEIEAQALTKEPPEKSCSLLKELCETAVIKIGAHGSWAGRGNEKFHQPALKVPVCDTIGAGDLFASGFLHGYLADRPLEECPHYGTIVASEVVQVCGANIDMERWEKIKKQLFEFEV